jgi:5,10-methylenetetrahydrofolate reductase
MLSMAKIVDLLKKANGRPFFICDVSPPRGADPDLLEPARFLDANVLSVNYSPGRSARVNSAIAAGWIKANTGKEAMFALATRDMNRLALQSLLLGAQLLGLENLVVLKGDRSAERESLVREVDDLRPTELLRSIGDMNRGVDFKGLKLRAATDFCAGAALDLGRPLDREVALTRRKVEAGARFFLSQPTFDTVRPRQFLDRYEELTGEKISPPIFHGVQVMAPDSLVFGRLPDWVTVDLDRGRSGRDIALQVIQEFADARLSSIYLVPPVKKGGRRDYEAAQAVLEAARG